MNKVSSSMRVILSILTVVIVAGLLLSGTSPLPEGIGLVDFRPYWSSTYLIANGQDFSDPKLIDEVERTLTGWVKPYTMFAWFSPIGNLVLLPYIQFPFAQAAYYWFLTNIAVLFISSILLWRNTTKYAWIAPFSTFCFSMTLLSLIFGQVNTLVFLGLALFLFFVESGHRFFAGASLVLTTIKPHLVIITLPLLLMDLIRRRRFRTLAGFACVLIGCAFILFILYPNWSISYWHLVSSGMETARETPTLNGLIVVAGGTTWGKWIWLVGLVLIIAIWSKCGREWNQRVMIDATLLAGMMIAPVGWSYDQVMLLLPILTVLQWVVNGSLDRKVALAVTLILIIVNAITFYERVLAPSEVWYFWVPIAVSAVYLIAWHRKRVLLTQTLAQAA